MQLLGAIENGKDRMSLPPAFPKGQLKLAARRKNKVKELDEVRKKWHRFAPELPRRL